MNFTELQSLLLSRITIPLPENLTVTYLTLFTCLFTLVMLWLGLKLKNTKAQREFTNAADDVLLTPFKGNHLELANSSSYKKQKIMNSPEYSIFFKLSKILKDDFYIFPQVALGEVLTSEDGHAAINAKRVDLLIVDSAGFAVAAIEFKGAGKHGHYQANAVERDAVKYIALKKAGIKYIALGSTDEFYLRQELENAGFILNQEAAA